MSSTLEEIKEAALALPEVERAELADILYDSVESSPPERLKTPSGLHSDWYAVADERIDELLSGRAKGVPEEEAMARLRRAIDEASRVS